MPSPRCYMTTIVIGTVVCVFHVTLNVVLGYSLTRNYPLYISESTGISSHVVMSHNTSDPALYIPDNQVDKDEYRAMLTAHAGSNKTIILALVDMTFMDMALNFYETSLLKFGIRNYLFIGTNRKACSYLIVKRIPCYVYMTDINAERATVYGSAGFKSKMNIRTFMILDALHLGFTALHTDVDVVFLKNPIPDIECVDSCHMTALWDEVVFNAGFIFIRPTNLTKQVYTLMSHFATTTKMDDQTALNKAVHKVRMGDLSRYFFIQKLPPEKYLCGKLYFQHGKRHFAGDNPCDECVVVHNNWLVTKEAKRYRFREAHLWMYDEDGYFSDTSRKYFTYQPPSLTNYSEHIKDLQLKSLQTALFIGNVLNRTVILPTFQCMEVTPRCPLNGLIKIAAFDEVFDQKYRESTFSSHSKVPSVIALPVNHVNNVHSFQHSQRSNQEISNTIGLRERKQCPDRRYLIELFGDIKRPVLHFGSLHELCGNSSVPEEETDFKNLLSRAFIESRYSQMDRIMRKN